MQSNSPSPRASMRKSMLSLDPAVASSDVQASTYAGTGETVIQLFIEETGEEVTVLWCDHGHTRS
jgi:hypothetical protein